MFRTLMMFAVGMSGMASTAVVSAEAPETDNEPALAGSMTKFVANNPASTGPAINVIADERSVVPGGLFTVDVFVSNVADLMVYQVELAVTGGRQGRLSLLDVKIDTDRRDYVFGTGQVLKAEAPRGRRMGAMLVGGAVSVDESAYVGTYTFRASADAQGTFKVGLNGAPHSSFLLNSAGRKMESHSGRPVMVSVVMAAAESLNALSE